jgi:hypothetical protein
LFLKTQTAIIKKFVVRFPGKDNEPPLNVLPENKRMRKNQTSCFDRFILVRLALTALMVFGAFLVYFQTTALIRARQSESWPKTTAVLSVEIGQYRKNLSYQYSVDGVSYTADRVIFGELGDRVRSKEWIAVSESPNGSELPVYYSPGNPKESTLFTGLRAGSWFNFLLGVVFLLAGSLIMILLPRLKRIPEQ